MVHQNKLNTKNKLAQLRGRSLNYDKAFRCYHVRRNLNKAPALSDKLFQ